jgi:hypothetical protein
MIGPVEEAIEKSKQLMAQQASSKDDKKSKKADDEADDATVEKELAAERQWLAEQKKAAATLLSAAGPDAQKAGVLAVLGLGDTGSLNQASLKAYLADTQGFSGKAEAALKKWQSAGNVTKA